MRRSRVLSKIADGAIASCVKLNLSDPRVVELVGQSGIDAVWIDMEHVATDWHTVEHCVRAAKITDTDIIVRTAKGSYSDYVRPLEADATAIMIPHLMCLEEAREIVRMTKFHPLGRRPLDGGNQDGAYASVPTAEYIAAANRERFICVQVEDPEVMGDLDAVAALDGIDMIFFGPGDYSHALGVPGQLNHPEVSDARQRVAEACARHGKMAGTVAGSGDIGAYAELGYRFISVGADVLGLAHYFRGITAAFAEAGW